MASTANEDYDYDHEEYRSRLEMIPTKSLDIRPIQQAVQEINDSSQTLPEHQTSQHHVTDEEFSIDVVGTMNGKDKVALPSVHPNRPQGWRWWGFNACIWVAAFMYGLDTTIAANIQPQIYNALGELTKLSWIGTGFVLGSVATVLTIAHLFSLFNTRILVTIMFVLFTVGSVMCGAATNMDVEIGGRVVAGIGGGGIYLGGLHYISAFTAMQERPLYEASLGFFWGLGTIVGPLIGGGFSQTSELGWRWAFYINVILGGILTVIVAFFFPADHPAPNRTTKQKLKEVDWVGSFLIATWFAMFVTVLSYAGTSWRWQYGGTITLFVIFAVVTILFGLQQVLCVFTTKDNRVFPVEMLFNRPVLAAFIATAANASALWVTVYMTPLFYQFTKGDSAVHSAIRMLPLVFVLIFLIMFSGGTYPVVGRPAVYFLISGILTTAGGAAMFKIDADTPPAHIYGFLVLIGAGVGCGFQLGYAIAIPAIPAHRIPAAIGLINVAQIGSGAIALSIASSLFQNLGQRYLHTALNVQGGYNFSAAQIEEALAGADSVILMGRGKVVQGLAITAIDKAIGKTFALVCVGGAVTAVAALGLSGEGVPRGGAVGAGTDGSVTPVVGGADEVEEEEEEEEEEEDKRFERVAGR